MPQQTTIQEAFVSGELAPAMWGRVTNDKYKFGASTMRNGFCNFQGGYASRGGHAYVGTCKQANPIGGATVNNVSGGTPINSGPPRLIPFQFNVQQAYDLEFGDYYMRVVYRGAYITEAAKNVTAITRANPGVITITSHDYSNGDWVFGSGIGGMTEFNGLTFVVQNKTTDTFTLADLYGNPINTTGFPVFTSGGTFARIYTVTTPYAAVDLPYLKFTQSADEMSLTCWNQSTLTEYPPYDLTRSGNTDWEFSETVFGETIASPTNVAVTAVNSTTVDTWYAYAVTAVDSATGAESIASSVVQVQNNDIAVNAGSNNITWTQVTGASHYNVYAAAPYYSTSGTPTVQIGVPFGYLGSALGTSFIDSNITADFTTTPPLDTDPFAVGAIIDVPIVTPGSGQTQDGVGYSITTTHGTGFSGTPIINASGALVGFYIAESGENFAPGDTITITDSDGGAVVGTATLTVGPTTGTYPGVVAYFQQRRTYGSTQNNPDTYFMSQPGAYTNFDASIPTVDSDAITGTPWGQQVNGIQFMTPMPGGLVIFTGDGAWQLSGGNAIAITPADQDAQPQTRYGCSSTLPPIPVNYHILFVRENDGIAYDLVYNFFANIYTGSDLTIFSNHLFDGYTLVQWAYAEKPAKIIWAVRSDGILLSLTYIAEQQEQGWARHDTNGLYVGICSIQEPPVDAVYVIVQRFVNGHWLYYHERFDNRLWTTVEDCVCVDAALTYPMTFPAATLTPAAANGTSNITSTIIAEPGTGFTSPTAQAVDSTGTGTGATFIVSLSGTSLNSVVPVETGQNYTPGYTKIIISDPTGTNAVVYPVITNYVNFSASASVFTSGMVGDVLRVGNGKATIVSQTGTACVGNITVPITATITDDPNNTPIPAISGTWSVSTPTTVVSGLNHLDGLQVTGLADGGVINPQTVQNGQIILPIPASQITVGLAFLPQLQTLKLDIPSQSGTTQTKRKNIPSVGIRVHGTRGVSAGRNQPDASAQPGQVNVPWKNMIPVKELNQNVPIGQPIPLFTGDYFVNIGPDWNEAGQVAFQQNYPLPMNVDAQISYSSTGDSAG